MARHARIGKATIYSRFIGKRELMHALMLRRIEARRAMLMAEGSALPLKEAFCMRATRILDMLHTPEQKLLERLIDWFDQESGAGKTGTRATAYRGGINAIVEQLQAANDAGLATIVNLHQAAQFWLEGLLGHARITESEGSAEPHQHESWARQFTEFFFAGLTALQPPTEE